MCINKLMQTVNKNKMWKQYLLWFAQEHIEFRFQEINSLLSLYKLEMRFSEKPTPQQPFWIVEFPREEDAKKLASRSVLLRSCIELWAHAKTTEDLHRNLKSYPTELVLPHLKKGATFKIQVETFCKHFTQKEKVAKLEAFDYLPYNGEVQLKDPDTCLQYIEYYGTDPVAPPKEPYDLFFGRLVSNGLRQLIKYLSLKTRKFIGNTSMDPQLSLLMANQAQIKKGDLVLDPFVGSGSLLVAAAQFGGWVVGSDIDFMMLHAKNKPSRIKQDKRADDESVLSNMRQYNLEAQYLDVLVNDFTIPFWREGFLVDAIITDPPYGIREATERIGTNKEPYKLEEKHLKTHIPSKIDYSLSKLYSDLLNFAVKHLKIGGKLVSWFPIFRPDYTEEGLPKHSCLRLTHNSEQVLNKYTSRRLLTYEKVADISDLSDEALAFNSAIPDFRSKYYETREETRRERRMKQSELRKECFKSYTEKMQKSSENK